MEPRYVILFDYSTGELVKIKLTDQELAKSEEYDSFEDFLSELESKYDFRLKVCIFMTCETLSERTYNL